MKILIYIPLCLIPFCFNAQLKKHKKELKSLFQNSHNGAQVSIGYIEGDNLNFLGFRKKDDKFQWLKNQDSVYEIGSITKVFTSYFLSTSISNNKVSLNDSVFKSLEFNLPKSITYKQLSNHTSGLPRLPSNLVRDNFLDPYSSYTEEKFISYFKSIDTLNSKPGKKIAYSNIGASLLGYSICKISKMKFEDMLQQYVCIPFKMNFTTTNRSIIENKLVKGYNMFGINPYWNKPECLFGSGVIMSCANDLTKFLLKFISSDDETITRMLTPTHKRNNNISIGLGWFILNIDNESIHWHNGATGGFHSFAAFNKKRKTGIVILSNTQFKVKELQEIGFEILK
ncbi:MAG: serine hydrolase domain-containing protein [Crocinitomicaceae bacterium]